jgi:hypothetical protein
MKKDNSTLSKKSSLRAKALAVLAKTDEPFIMETHGGFGKLWAQCYSHIPEGVVFEKDPIKALRLAKQRPHWSVYECDCVKAIKEQVGSHLPINYVDVDPYGDPWPVIEAFLSSDRPKPERVMIVTNDGLRQKLQLGGAWVVGSMDRVVSQRGNATVYHDYLDVCKDMMRDLAAKGGYQLTRWTAYFTGRQEAMTHYAALLTRQAS